MIGILEYFANFAFKELPTNQLARIVTPKTTQMIGMPPMCIGICSIVFLCF
jgi:hypothetical protein